MPGNDPVSKRPKILLVDDREDNLLSIEAVLEPDGYQFFRAYSGHQALKILLSEVDFAMILMDVKMPVLNGFETAALIYERDRLKNIPIIFITANNYGDENLFKGYKAGGIDYIFKPINPVVLRAKVAVFVDIYLKSVQLHEHERNLKIANENLEQDFKNLKTSWHQARQGNLRLQEQVSDLATALVSSTSLNKTSRPDQEDLNDVLKDFVGDIQEEVKEKVITVAFTPLPSLPVTRVLIRPLLHQVVSMILDSHEGSKKPFLQIRSEITNSNNTKEEKSCRIIFESNGFSAGKNPDLASKATSKPLNGAPKKFSFNLALYQKIMEHHQGSIQVDSDGGNTTLIISFPVKK